MRRVIVWETVELLVDGYSVPKGSIGTPKPLDSDPDFYEIYWLPPNHGCSLPVHKDDVIESTYLSIPEELWAEEWK